MHKAAGGTNQRLKNGPATVRSRSIYFARMANTTNAPQQESGHILLAKYCQRCSEHLQKYGGSVWESNPLRALFKPPAGFEDQGRRQPCKHSLGQSNYTFKKKWVGFLFVLSPTIYKTDDKLNSRILHVFRTFRSESCHESSTSR